MIADAISRFHDILHTGTIAADTQELLDQLQSAHGLTFGERPLCTVLRPRLLSLAQDQYLRTQVETLLSAFRTTYERARIDPTFRKQYRLLDWEEQLLTVEPGFPDPSPTSRLDAFYDGKETLKFTEYNTETPAGAGYSDALAELFMTLPAVQEFQKKYHVLHAPCRPGVLQALLASYKQWQSATQNTNKPRIAILDWREVPTFSEFVLFYDYFHSLGLEARNVDPRECEFIDGKLMCGDYHITLIYKRVLISELVERGGLDHPVIQAVRAGAVCMVNTFRCKILFKKASLAVLSDEQNRGLFAPDQLQAIQSHIPWSRVVENRKTEINSMSIDLIPYILEQRHNLVLKPNDDYGGRGIVLGWTVDQTFWEQSVQTALNSPYVVQEKIELPREPYPHHDTRGHLQVVERMLDTNPYVAYGGVTAGCLTRISTDELVNVTAGGGSTVPTFLIDPR